MGTGCSQPGSGRNEDTLVLLGPVIGKVTHCTGNILLEIDEDRNITCEATLLNEVPNKKGHKSKPIKVTKRMKAGEPMCFALDHLVPSSEYTIRFYPLPAVQQEELRERGCVLRTLAKPNEMKRIRICAVSCDWCPWRLDEPKCKVENPWKQVAQLCKDGEIDLMFHLGDQVYTWENGCQLAAMRALDLCAMEGVGEELVQKMKRLGARKLQEAYQATWNVEHTSKALSHSSHLMIWSDNDVTNDFTIARNKDGYQSWDKEYLSTAMRVYRMYQRALHDPKVNTDQHQLDHRKEVEEWHSHIYGPLGVFFIDMRGNRIQPDGEIKPKKAAPLEKLPNVMSNTQRKEMQQLFADEDLMCIIVCAEIPFAGENPDGIQEKALKFPMLKDHWCYQMEELTFILDLAFKFKASKPGRECILLGGDIHVSVETIITELATGIEILQLTTSPITNDVSRFRPVLDGIIDKRYVYKHNPKPYVKQRTFAMLDISFEGEDKRCVAKCRMETVDTVPGESI
jgi:phosphodiesterase/alkaline phosphatase D-like protein